VGKFNPYLQENMYRMDDEPPKMELNDYIVEYKRTGDEYWLACFLHCFERNWFNRWVYRQCNRYNQLSRFQDFKQEMTQALLIKLPDYDPTVGTTLIQFAARSMLNAIHEYMRKNVGVYLLSDDYYKNLRKVNAVFYRDIKLSYDNRIEAVQSETGFSLKRILGYIEHGSWFKYPESIDSNISDFVRAKLTPDDFLSPEHVVLREMFNSACFEQVERLRERDKCLLYDYLGIVDFSCGWVIDKSKIRYGDIADKHQLRNEQSVTNRYRKIIAEVRAGLEKQGWIEGRHTPKFTEPIEKSKLELTDLDREST